MKEHDILNIDSQEPSTTNIDPQTKKDLVILRATSLGSEFAKDCRSVIEYVQQLQSEGKPITKESFGEGADAKYRYAIAYEFYYTNSKSSESKIIEKK